LSSKENIAISNAAPAAIGYVPVLTLLQKAGGKMSKSMENFSVISQGWGRRTVISHMVCVYVALYFVLKWSLTDLDICNDRCGKHIRQKRKVLPVVNLVRCRAGAPL
jgi:hypothetical protein